jgi:hypothetical protein
VSNWSDFKKGLFVGGGVIVAAVIIGKLAGMV